MSWTFRGGMDLRDEVAGTAGTIWTNHFLRTGFEMFTAKGGYVAEKAESESGWLFPFPIPNILASVNAGTHSQARDAPANERSR